MKIKVTVRLNKIQPGAFLHRHEFREMEVEAENHSEILKKAFTKVLETEKLEELFGIDIFTYSQDEEPPESEEVSVENVSDMIADLVRKAEKDPNILGITERIN